MACPMASAAASCRRHPWPTQRRRPGGSGRAGHRALDHYPHFGVCIDGHQFNPGVSGAEDPEYLIGEGLTDPSHFREVEYYCPESVDTCQQPLGLGPRNQQFIAVLRQSYRNYGLVEEAFITAGEFGEYFSCGSRGVIVQLHQDMRALRGFRLFQNPVGFVEIVGEISGARQYGDRWSAFPWPVPARHGVHLPDSVLS